ncbi:MAG TPA: arsenic resistance N-acetyltransferase ArsN2 [Gemmatimonadales bacterium]|nr:arsenic resistance N-acetyltransferase ArsN2 [Gemmatimonadales bacterium]
MLDLLERSKLPRAGVADHIGSVIVAREGTRIIGCVGVEIYGSAGLLRSVAVDIAHRGLGLGIQLTETALDLAKQRGVKTLYLLTERSAGFFLRFGFKKITRGDVDPAVKVSAEFTGACPDTATVLRFDLPR